MGTSTTNATHPMLLNDQIRRILTEHMEQNDLSLHQMARLTGVTRPAIKRILSGERSPMIDTVDKIFDALGLIPTLRVD